MNSYSLSEGFADPIFSVIQESTLKTEARASPKHQQLPERLNSDRLCSLWELSFVGEVSRIF
jgi:hypothetical protein